MRLYASHPAAENKRLSEEIHEVKQGLQEMEMLVRYTQGGLHGGILIQAESHQPLVGSHVGWSHEVVFQEVLHFLEFLWSVQHVCNI